jgi:hypothetical protein
VYIEFAENVQHDVSEFLYYITDIFDEEGIFDSFTFFEVLETTCCKCGTISRKREKHTQMSLAVPKNCSSLQQVLRRQFQVDEIPDFDCSVCESFNQAILQRILPTFPDFFILILKRFGFSTETGTTKNDQKILIDEVMTVPLKCSLVAVIVHIGRTPDSGHYSTLVQRDGMWILYDDDKVRSVSTQDFSKMTQKNAYILVYKRENEATIIKNNPPPLPQGNNKKSKSARPTHLRTDLDGLPSTNLMGVLISANEVARCHPDQFYDGDDYKEDPRYADDRIVKVMLAYTMSHTGGHSIKVAPTFLYTQFREGLREEKLDKLNRWLKKANILFDVGSKTFIPLNIGKHWLAAYVLVNGNECCDNWIIIFDSVQGRDGNVPAKIQEIVTAGGGPQCTKYFMKMPRQKNGFDCGMHCALVLKFLCSNLLPNPMPSKFRELHKTLEKHVLPEKAAELRKVTYDLMSNALAN